MAELLMTPELEKKLLDLQQAEITEYRIYTAIARSVSDPHNRNVLERIASQEFYHYGIWKGYTKRDVEADNLRLGYYCTLARLLGITFTVKMMERVEKQAQKMDSSVLRVIPEASEILSTEESHEREIIALIDEERLRYMGSVVLGLNDALVEFTGSLAGFTFALQNSRLIAMAGLIMGIAASLSMAASEYLSRRSGGADDGIDPKKASIYTGVAYIVTVILLILPFLLLDNPYVALPLTLAAAVLIILLFTFYISVAKDLPFRQRFAEMAIISLGIAAISFAIGILIRLLLGVNV